MLRKTPLKAKKGFSATRKPWGSKSGLKATTGLTSRTTLKTKTTLKAKKRMKKAGKVGEANMAARKEIVKKAEAMKLTSCELGPILVGEYGINVCLYNFALAPAHRHKRAWYKGDAEKLADVKQWVAACQCCHDAIEFDAALTEAVFMKLRGEEEFREVPFTRNEQEGS